MVSQGIFRNDLASPAVIGTTAGASLAVVSTFYSGAAFGSIFALPIAAIGGAILSTLLVYGLAQHTRSSVHTLLLAGFSMNAFLGAGSSLILSLFLEDFEAAAAALRWLFGGFGGSGYEHASIVGVLTAIGLLGATRLAPKLDALTLGDQVATSISIDVPRTRIVSILIIAILSGGAVAVGGVLPFVGLMVPHITRKLIGPNHRRLLTYSVINGFSFVILTDAIARSMVAPRELEVGILTALIGGPFFMGILWSKKSGARL